MGGLAAAGLAGAVPALRRPPPFVCERAAVRLAAAGLVSSGLSDAGAIHRANAEAAERVNLIARRALELAAALTQILQAAPVDEGAHEGETVKLELPWVELRKARAVLESIADPDW